MRDALARVFAAVVVLALGGVAVACSTGSDSGVGSGGGGGLGGVGGAGGAGGSGGASGCPSGLLDCAGKCVDPQYNPNHCGACNTKCGAGEFCSNGSCGSTCSGGTTECGGSIT